MNVKEMIFLLNHDKHHEMQNKNKENIESENLISNILSKSKFNLHDIFVLINKFQN